MRPLLACMWIESKHESPPMEFDKLMTLLDDGPLVGTINDLLARKKFGVEMGLEPRIEIINNFIEQTLGHFDKIVSTFNPNDKPNPRLLEDGFVRILDGCKN